MNALNLTYHDLVPLMDDMADQISDQIAPYYAEVDINWNKSNSKYAFDITYYDEDGKRLSDLPQHPDSKNGISLKDKTLYMSETELLSLRDYGDIVSQLREDEEEDLEGYYGLNG